MESRYAEACLPLVVSLGCGFRTSCEEEVRMVAKRCVLVDYFSIRATRSVGLMDKVSASGAGDSRFEPWANQAELVEG